MSKKILALLLAAVMVLSLAGCGAEKPAEMEAPKEPVSEEPAAETAEDVAAAFRAENGWYSAYYTEAMKGTTLNLYGVTDGIIPVLDAFYEDTGITVENLTMKNGEILERVKNEHEAGTVNADIWFTGGADAFISAAESGLLTAYVSPEAESIALDMKDASGYWTGTSLTVVNWVVNTEVCKELGIEVPAKWDDLLQPELKGWISMPNPASSGTGYNTVSAILQTRGEEEGWNYLTTLIDYVPFFPDRGSDPANNVIAGEAAVGINAGTGNVSLSEDYDNILVVYPEDGTGWWPQPLAILDGCKNEDAAKVFVDWVLSERGLAEVAKAQNAAVVKDGVTTPDGILELSDLTLFATDFKANASDRSAILEAWAEKVAEAGK